MLAVAMMLTTSVCAKDINLIINDEKVETQVKPIQEAGTTLVPTFA